MIHGDITYVDEALYENKLSVVFDDLSAARETLDRVREFVRNHPTVYMGTHTPQGYENLEAKRVMDLNNPVETIFAEVTHRRVIKALIKHEPMPKAHKWHCWVKKENRRE